MYVKGWCPLTSQVTHARRKLGRFPRHETTIEVLLPRFTTRIIIIPGWLVGALSDSFLSSFQLSVFLSQALGRGYTYALRHLTSARSEKYDLYFGDKKKCLLISFMLNFAYQLSPDAFANGVNKW